MSALEVRRTIGVVIALLPDAKFSFRVEGRQLPLTAHPSTEMRKKYMKVKLGDEVWIEPITGSSEWRMIELINSSSL